MDEQERLEQKKEKRIRKALRSYKWRPFKNFLWWITGLISSVIIFVGAIVAGLALIPINTYTGGKNDGVISDELASLTILNLVMNLDKYGTADIPIIKQLLIDNIDNGNLGQYVQIDYEKFDALSFSSMGSGLTECIKVVASLDRLGVSGMLGKLGSLETLTEFTEVEETVDTQASNFNAKLYYYDKNQIGLLDVSPMNAIENNGKSFVRAFDDNGNRVAPASAILYYGAITKISISDALVLLDETFSRIEATELLDIASGGSSGGEEGFINKLLEGKKLNELGSIKEEDLNLCDILGGKEDDEIFKILSGVTGKSWDEITVADLTGELVFDDVKLDTILKKADDEGNPINVQMWDVLNMAVEDIDGDGIEISELSNFNYDGILLNKVMPYDNDNTDGKTNNKLYDVLFDVTGKSYDKITLGDLNNFNTDNIKINTVVPKTDDNAALYDILKDITNENDFTKITIGSLKNFAVDKLHLDTVLGDSINDTLKSVLCEALDKSTDQFDEILVSDIGSEAFDIGKVRLSSVMTKTDDSYGNAILDTLLADTENPVTIANVGTRISELSLYEAYGKECFKPLSGNPSQDFVSTDTLFALEYIDTVDDEDSEPDHWAYVHKDEQYFIDNPDKVKYGLCKNDGIWLLLCFNGEQFEDVGGVDTDGRPEKYVISDHTLGTLENEAASLSAAFIGATIQQLIDAGVIPADNYNQKLYTLTLLDAVGELSNAFDKTAGLA